MEFLNSDFILSEDEISILDFEDTPIENTEEKKEENNVKEYNKALKKKRETENIER